MNSYYILVSYNGTQTVYTIDSYLASNAIDTLRNSVEFDTMFYVGKNNWISSL